MGSFEFVVVASLRAAQLARGCTPRVTEDHTSAMTAQLEVADGKVAPLVTSAQPSDDQPDV
jgi:DNA-directed RNA polymerase subunit K/omega